MCPSVCPSVRPSVRVSVGVSACVHACRLWLHACKLWCMCMHVYRHTSMRERTYALSVRSYLRLSACMYTRMYIRMYAIIHVCRYTGMCGYSCSLSTYLYAGARTETCSDNVPTQVCSCNFLQRGVSQQVMQTHPKGMGDLLRHQVSVLRCGGFDLLRS